jgi:Uma2 family endonuclease
MKEEVDMTLLAKKFYTPAEYFKFEEQSETKHEYRDGQIVPMAGSSNNHSLITVNITAEARQFFKGKNCRVYNNDMRIFISAYGIYTYPDVSVACGKIEFAKGRNDTITNPTLIIEVLSPSTANYDRGRKFTLYQSVKSLRAYVLIEQHRPHVEYFHKLADGTWELETYDDLDAQFTLRALKFALRLRDIYDTVDWLKHSSSTSSAHPKPLRNKKA